MQKLTLPQAFSRLKQASAIIVNKTRRVLPTLTELTGSGSNQFLHLCGQEKNQEYNPKFVEQNNQEVSASDTEGWMILRSKDNTEVHLTLLKPAIIRKQQAAARTGAKVIAASAKRNR